MQSKLSQKILTLSNGKKMPMFGLGTWNGTPDEVQKAVYCAIKNNYRLIDCAAVYYNEGGVGKAIKRCIDEGIVKREDLFIVTKLWNTCHAVEHVEPAIKNSLKLLGLSYVDLYLVHFPIGFSYNGIVGEGSPSDAFIVKDPKTGGPKHCTNAPLYKTWGAMEALIEKGYTKSIGVSNYTIPLIIDMLSYAKIMPVVNQIEVQPYMPRWNLVKLCKSLNIEVMAYSPLGSSSKDLLEDEVVNKIAKKYQASPAQILIYWSLKSGHIVIPKSTSEKHLEDNIEWSFELSKEDMEELNGLDKTPKSFCNTEHFWGHVNVNTF